MCMYCAIACASGPGSIVFPAMSIVGHCLTDDAMPAFCASALIADGVMSDPATMYSCERLLLTVCRPLTPIAMATTPNTTRTAAATNPPISSALRMSRLLSEPWCVSQECRSWRRERHPGRCGADRGASRVSTAGKPQSGGGEGLARAETGRDRPCDVERRDDADRSAGAGLGDGEVRDPVLRHQAAGLADRAVGRNADERRHSRGAGGQRVEIEPRGRDEIEVGDDRPQVRGVVLFRVLEDEDRVHAVGRHHPGHDPERRLWRTADDAAAHRIADRPRLERNRKVFATMLHVHHAPIVVTPARSRIRVNYRTGDGVRADRPDESLLDGVRAQVGEDGKHAPMVLRRRWE